MFEGFVVIWKNRNLIIRMAYKEISDRYVGSVLGIFWSIIGPLFLVTIYALVFTFIFQVKIGTSVHPLDYALYAIAGLVPWIVMQDGLVKTTSSVLSNSSLVKQIIFPVDILPLNSVVSTLPTMFFGLGLYIILILLFGHIHVSLWLLLLPVVILCQILFSFGIGWILAALGVYFRDMREIVNLTLLIFMYITPVLYLENMLPAALVWPIRFNPFTHLLNMYRDILYYGHIQHLYSFIIFGILSLIIFVVGYNFYKKMKIFFANVL